MMQPTLLLQPSPTPTEIAIDSSYLHTQIPLAYCIRSSSSTSTWQATQSKNRIFKPTTFTDGKIRYPTPQALTALLQGHELEPTYYTQASQHAEWRKAMNEEFDAVLQNGTWSLVPPTPAMNVVGCKWVFRIKRKADGKIKRYKARLVAKGFH
jgi:hypothetical protein